MKILFCDLLLQKGNRHVDECMLSILYEKNEVYVLAEGQYKLENRINYCNYKEEIIQNPKGVFRYYYTLFKRMLTCAKYAKSINPDIIFFSTYENRVFIFGMPFFKNMDRIFVVENNNIDYLTNTIHRLLYGLYSNKIHHVVFEKIFGDYLISAHNVPIGKVHVVPHIQYKNEYDKIETKGDTAYDCIAISGSNDDSMINALIEHEKTNHILEKNGIRMLIKSHTIRHESEVLKVINDFIPIELYNQLFKQCKVVYAPFPLTYKYRMSGCFVDAFSNHKPVVASSIELAKYYNQCFGSIIMPCSSIEQSVDEIVNYCRNNIALDFSLFEKEHSYDSVKDALLEIIQKV